MAKSGIPELKIENAKLIFKNFSGEERKSPTTGKIVNRAGDRNFCVIIDDPEAADRLKSAGWNIKETKVNDEYDDQLLYLPVAVEYSKIPPAIWMRNRNNTVMLTEDTVGTLDRARIKTADIVINPYAWEVNGKCGIKAYLQKAGFEIEVDEFEEKWAAVESPEE